VSDVSGGGLVEQLRRANAGLREALARDAEKLSYGPWVQAFELVGRGAATAVGVRQG
jgi:hypothetical protein